MTDTVKAAVRERYSNCESVQGLADDLGLSIHTLRTFARKAKLRRNRAGVRKIKESDVPKIINAYERGLSCRVIGKHFGLSHQGILNVIRKFGGTVQARSCGRNAYDALVLAELTRAATP